MCDVMIPDQKIDNLVKVNNQIVDSVLCEIQNAIKFCEWYQNTDGTESHLKCFDCDKELNFLIFSTYAFMENVIKNIFENVLEAISGTYKLKDLTDEIGSLYYREELLYIKQRLLQLNKRKLERERGKSERGSEITRKLLEINNDLCDVTFESSGDMIQTNSNLSYDKFMSIASLFFDETKLDEYCNNYKCCLDTIVHYRNNIAHGNVASLNNVPSHIKRLDNQSTIEEVEKICTFIKEVKNDAEKYIRNGSYLK